MQSDGSYGFFMRARAGSIQEKDEGRMFHSTEIPASSEQNGTAGHPDGKWANRLGQLLRQHRIDRSRSQHPLCLAGRRRKGPARWTLNPESPFFVKPRLDIQLGCGNFIGFAPPNTWAGPSPCCGTRNCKASICSKISTPRKKSILVSARTGDWSPGQRKRSNRLKKDV